ncbi:hypothetical protein D3C72_2395920 [compost metagenome]
MLEQALVGRAGKALAVVRKLVGRHARRRQRLIDIQAQLFGVAQVLEQGRNRGIAEIVHRLVIRNGSIGDSAWPDATVTPGGGWLV